MFEPAPIFSFSVVIPTYNSSEFITQTLDCLIKQTFKDFEAVIINDGSNDSTQEVVSEYIASHPALHARIFYQENKGIAGARNRGILEAKSRYIAFLDHDDIWYAQKLDKCYEILKRYPEIDLACHNEAMRDQAGKIVRILYHGPYVSDMFRRLLFKGNCLSTSAVVAKREILLDAGLFREYPEFSTVEDYDLWLRLSKKCKFYFIPEVLGEYIVNEKNASLNFEKHYNNQINALRKNFAEFEKKRVLDIVSINFRIIKIYLLLAKKSMLTKKVRNVFYYFLKAFLQFFAYA